MEWNSNDWNEFLLIGMKFKWLEWISIDWNEILMIGMKLKWLEWNSNMIRIKFKWLEWNSNDWIVAKMITMKFDLFTYWLDKIGSTSFIALLPPFSLDWSLICQTFHFSEFLIWYKLNEIPMIIIIFIMSFLAWKVIEI